MGISILNRDLPLHQITGIYERPNRLQLYSDLLHRDETVAACAEYITNTAAAKIGNYVHPMEMIQDFVRAQFSGVSGGAVQLFKNLMSGIFYGFSVCEICTNGNGQLTELPLVDPMTIGIRLSEDPEDWGQVQGFYQFFNLPYQAFLPIEKSVYYRANISANTSISPYGDSRLEPILGLCEMKRQVIESWNATLKRFGSPIAKYKIDNPGAIIPTGPETSTTKIEYIKKEVSNIQNLSGWIVSGDDDVDFIFPPNVGSTFTETVAHLNKLIMRGLMTPSLLMDSGDTGSYSLGITQQELYFGFIRSLIAEINEVVIGQLVRPLIQANFSGVEEFGQFEIIQNNEDITTQSSLLIPLIQAGLIDLDDPEELQRVKSRLGLSL